MTEPQYSSDQSPSTSEIISTGGGPTVIELSQSDQDLQAQTLPLTGNKEQPIESDRQQSQENVPSLISADGSQLDQDLQAQSLALPENKEQSIGSDRQQSQENVPSLISADAQPSSATMVPSKVSTGAIGSSPVSMDERIVNFQKVEAMRLENNDHNNSVDQGRCDARRNTQIQQQHTLEALRRWHRAEENEVPLLGSDSPNLWKVLAEMIWPSKIPLLPSIEKLTSLVHHYYPPRAQIKVEVCDFGPGRATHFTTTLPQIQSCWESKPEWATVRWIHAPLGIGIVPSSVEDLFLHSKAERGKPFKQAGSPGFPYPAFDVLNIRNKDSFQEMRDAYVLSKKVPQIAQKLDQKALDGIDNLDLRKDILWRSKHLGVLPTFWNLSQSDMAWQLSEGFGVGWHGPMSALKPLEAKTRGQILSRHPFFESSQIVRDAFQLYHRGDGVLLTFLPADGVNYIDRDLANHLKEPPEGRFDNADASVLSNVWNMFSNEGTDQWHQNTVEWFMIYLMTEMAATPHTLSQGYNAPSLPMAYHLIVQDLKNRRFSPWRRHESVKLVQDYISCVDELTVIVKDMKKVLHFLKNLGKDCEQFDLETDGKTHNAKGTSSVARVEWAVSVVTENHDLLASTLEDLSDSMLALFQLRSIEQNELAIMADSQNKAILVFTGVTIIFLPLSFFASYFGMNLQGIIDTSKSETYFWALCGTLALVFIILTTLFAFRHKLAHLVGGSRRKKEVGGVGVGVGRGMVPFGEQMV